MPTIKGTTWTGPTPAIPAVSVKYLRLPPGWEPSPGTWYLCHENEDGAVWCDKPKAEWPPPAGDYSITII